MWLIVLLNGCGGLLVAATMKYADNIVKCFAAALAILSGTLLSIPCFGFWPSELFAAGAAFTVLATVLYSWAPKEPPAWARCAGHRRFFFYTLRASARVRPRRRPTACGSMGTRSM